MKILAALAVSLLLSPVPAAFAAAPVVPLPRPKALRHVVAKHAPAEPVAAAEPAPADAPPKLSNLADLVFDGIVGENAPEVDVDFVAGTALGTMPLLLERTTLDQLEGLYGGLIHSQGDAGDAVSWLCYTRHARTKADTPTTAWFTSSNEMAGKGNTLSMVVVENVDAAKVSGCATAPAGFAFPSFGVPSIGASLAALKAKFGQLVRDRQHNVYYNSTRALGDGSGMSVYQTLGYAMDRKGLVRGIAVSQVTTD